MMTEILRKLNCRRGFTLVELMVVIAVIGILAAIAVPRFASSQEAARTAKVQADLRTIDSALASYIADTGTTPADVANLDALTTAQTVSGRSYGPYLAATPAVPNGTVRVLGNATQAVTNYAIIGGRAAIQPNNYTVEQVH